MKNNKLPSDKDCLKKAISLCVDIEPEKKTDGEILPEECIIYTSDLIKLIKFCKTSIKPNGAKQINIRRLHGWNEGIS